MSLYRRILNYLLPYWKHIAISMISMMLFALLSGALVWLIGPLMATLFEYESMQIGTEQVKRAENDNSERESDEGQIIVGGIEQLRGKIKSSINALIVSDTKTKTLRNLCIVLLLIALAKSIFFYLRGYIMAFVEQKFIRNLRVDLFTHYQKLSLAYFHGTRTGKLISHVTNDVMILRVSINQVFSRIVTDPFLILIYLVFMFLISWKLLLISAVVLPLVFGMIYLIGRKLRSYSGRAQEQMANINTVLEENVSNIRIVKGFNTDEYEINKFEKHAEDYFKTLIKIFRVSHLSHPINELLGTAAVVIILWYGGQNVLAGSGISASDFVLFTFAMFSLIAPVKSVSNIHIRIQEGMAAAERIFMVLDSTVEIEDAPGATEIDKFSKEIRFENVGFSYKTTPEVLKNINFEARKGQLIAIVGPSGAGKSTLCDLIPRFYDPTEGRITLDGVDLREITLSSLRSQLGIVTQETMLFNDTIYNNVTYGLERVTMEQVVEATKIANAYDFIMDFENGFETPIGNRGVMLSGGQRQRIAIARAVLRNPEILIFDEATSSLDTESEQLVQEAIDRLLKGRTTIVIAHRLSTILNADKILVIKDGCLIDSGTHQELISRKGLYQRLYNLQFKEQNGNGA